MFDSNYLCFCVLNCVLFCSVALVVHLGDLTLSGLFSGPESLREIMVVRGNPAIVQASLWLFGGPRVLRVMVSKDVRVSEFSNYDESPYVHPGYHRMTVNKIPCQWPCILHGSLSVSVFT